MCVQELEKAAEAEITEAGQALEQFASQLSPCHASYMRAASARVQSRYTYNAAVRWIYICIPPETHSIDIEACSSAATSMPYV